MAVVWAYKPLKELDGICGMVVCEDDLAEKLLAAGKVQNPQDGAWHLTPIGEEATKEVVAEEAEGYQTKEIKPAAKRGRPSKKV